MRRLIPFVAAATLLLAACGGTDTTDTGNLPPASEDGAAGTCPEGTEDCNDTPQSSAMCIEEEPDCQDMIVSGEAGGTCLRGATDCNDTGPPHDGDELMSSTVPVVESFRGELVEFEVRPDDVVETYPLFLSEAVVDGATVSVAFSAQRPECGVISAVELDEREDAVIVTVHFGELSEPDEDCGDDEIIGGFVTFELDAPLGDRELRDGTRVTPEGSQG